MNMTLEEWILLIFTVTMVLIMFAIICTDGYDYHKK